MRGPDRGFTLALPLLLLLLFGYMFRHEVFSYPASRSRVTFTTCPG